MAKKKKSQRRDAELRIRLTEDERNLLDEIAGKVGGGNGKTSTWARGVLLGAGSNKTIVSLPRIIAREWKDGEDTASNEDVHFIEDLAREGERGCVLLAAEFINRSLMELLETFFALQSGLHRQDAKNLLKGRNAIAPDLSSRANLCLAVGLIQPDSWKAITWLRVLRNKIAHPSHSKEFTDERTAKVLDSFEHAVPHRESATVAAGWTIATTQVEFGDISLAQQRIIVAAATLYLDIRKSLDELVQ